MWTVLKIFCWICYNTASVFCFWFSDQEACDILTSRPGIEPVPPALEEEILTTGLPGKSLCQYFECLWLSQYIINLCGIQL